MTPQFNISEDGIEVIFTLEFLSLPCLKLLLAAAKIEQADYAMASELSESDHEALDKKVKWIAQAIDNHRLMAVIAPARVPCQ